MVRMTLAIPLLALIVSLAPLSGGPPLVFGQEDLVLDNPDAYPKKTRTAVAFPHQLHMEGFACLECHHDYTNGENTLDEDELVEGNPAIRCAACHATGSASDLRRAYHLQCLGCHRQERIAGSTTGPELCGQCHIR